MENRKVIVVGAGIGGLAAAYWLRQRRYDVEVLEATERPGGRMVTLERKGDRVDVGAQFYYSNCAHAVEMIDRAGLTPTRRSIKGKVQYRLNLAKVPDMCPGGKSILTGWAVYPTALELMKETDDQVLKKARQDMEVMIPGLSQWIEEAQVFRHPFVNALYPPGSYRRVLDFQTGARRLQGVSFVSSALEGTAMEAAMVSAAAAVKRVCGWGGTA